MPDWNGWETDGTGALKLCPLIGYASMTAMGATVLLRLDFEKDASGTAGKIALPITPSKARELAERLIFLADQIENQRVTPTPKN